MKLPEQPCRYYTLFRLSLVSDLYQADTHHSVAVGMRRSSMAHVPQRSNPGSVLFISFTLPLGHISADVSD